MDHVRFRDLRFYQHGAHIRQRQNIGRLLSCNHRLSLQGSDLRHFPRHGGDNTGIFQVGFRGVQRGPITFDLGIYGANTRLFNRHLRRRGIQILLRYRLSLS